MIESKMFGALNNRVVADPGFPVGGGGGVDLQHGCFSAKICAKMKEFGPMGGHAPGMPPPLDPPMQSIRIL